MANVASEDWSDDEDRRNFSEIEEIGDRRNEIVFIGIFDEKSRENIKKVLDNCPVTDEQMEKVLEHGIDMEDPFESWYLGN